MQSITYLINSIVSFSKQNFKFSQYFQPLNILNKIPDSISDHLNNVDFIYHLNEASKHIDWLNDFFENNINPITKKELSHLKSLKNKDIQIPYADFKVDEPPLFENNIVQQLSFEDINRNDTIAPVRRRNPDSFSFDGVCPYCGAPKEYIYTIITKAEVNTSVRPVKILLPLKLPLKKPSVSTALTVNANFLYTMTAMAISFMSA